MLGPHFYNEAIRKTVIGFGTLFNNIEIVKKDNAGTVIEAEKVPLAYGPKNKFLYRLDQSPDVTKKVAIKLPRLYFELTNVTYDSTRKTSAIKKIKAAIPAAGDAENAKAIQTQFVPVPYDMSFELGIIAKSSDDALQILEQILPYFQPSFNITLNFIPDMNEKRDIACILNGVDYADDWDDSFLERRSIVWTLQFTVKSYIYGPYSKADVIRKARVIETIGDKNVSKRNVERSYTPKALEDKNADGVIDTQDDDLVVSTDDFGFNEGFTVL